MPAVSLRCRFARPSIRSRDRHVRRLLRPTRPRRTIGMRSRVASAELIAAGPPSIWRYADLLPLVAPPPTPRLAPGLTPLVPAPRLAEALGIGELWLKLTRPTRRTRSRIASSPSLPEGAGAGSATRSRAPRPVTWPVRSRRGLPQKASRLRSSAPRTSSRRSSAAAAVYGATIYAVDGTYDDCSALRRAVVRARRGGSSTSTSARTTPKDRRRSPTRSRSSSAGICRMLSSIRSRPARCFKGRAGVRRAHHAGSRRGATPRMIGGQAEGCAPVAAAFAEDGGCTGQAGRRSPARSRSGTRLTATSPWVRPEIGRSDIHIRPRTRSG